MGHVRQPLSILRPHARPILAARLACSPRGRWIDTVRGRPVPFLDYGTARTAAESPTAKGGGEYTSPLRSPRATLLLTKSAIGLARSEAVGARQRIRTLFAVELLTFSTGSAPYLLHGLCSLLAQVLVGMAPTDKPPVGATYPREKRVTWPLPRVLPRAATANTLLSNRRLRALEKLSGLFLCARRSCSFHHPSTMLHRTSIDLAPSTGLALHVHGLCSFHHAAPRVHRPCSARPPTVLVHQPRTSDSARAHAPHHHPVAYALPYHPVAYAPPYHPVAYVPHHHPQPTLTLSSIANLPGPSPAAPPSATARGYGSRPRLRIAPPRGSVRRR